MLCVVCSVGACCLLVGCLLFVGCCLLLSIVLLFVACCLLFVVCAIVDLLSFVCLWCVVCCVMFVVCGVPHIDCCLLVLAHCLSFLCSVPIDRRLACR